MTLLYLSSHARRQLAFTCLNIITKEQHFEMHHRKYCLSFRAGWRRQSLAIHCDCSLSLGKISESLSPNTVLSLSTAIVHRYYRDCKLVADPNAAFRPERRRGNVIRILTSIAWKTFSTLTGLPFRGLAGIELMVDIVLMFVSSTSIFSHCFFRN